MRSRSPLRKKRYARVSHKISRSGLWSSQLCQLLVKSIDINPLLLLPNLTLLESEYCSVRPSSRSPNGMRVVSLLPSATEVLVASSPSPDEDDLLVGRSHECDYPVYVQKRPVLTSAKNKFESCSQMNDAVCSSLSAGDSLYDVDPQLLRVPIFSFSTSSQFSDCTNKQFNLHVPPHTHQRRSKKSINDCFYDSNLAQTEGAWKR